MAYSGSSGVFALDWSLTETDGSIGVPTSALQVGSEWLWRGDAVRLDGPSSVLPLGSPIGQEDLRSRVQRRADRITRVAIPVRTKPKAKGEPRGPGFVVSDGKRAWRGDWVLRSAPYSDLAVFSEGLPPIGVPLWVVEVQRPVKALPPTPVVAPEILLPGLAEGTLIATPLGPMPVETLRPGEQVLTRDHGPQPVIEVLSRRISGARLHVEPDLRPVIISHGAIASPPWSRPIRVSPAHRVLISGAKARDLFSEEEVLVAAGDLANWANVPRDLDCKAVEYHAVRLARAEIISACGHWCESMAPIETATHETPTASRRVLSPSEAAILAAHPAP